MTIHKKAGSCIRMMLQTALMLTIMGTSSGVVMGMESNWQEDIQTARALSIATALSLDPENEELQRVALSLYPKAELLNQKEKKDEAETENKNQTKMEKHMQDEQELVNQHNTKLAKQHKAKQQEELAKQELARQQEELAKQELARQEEDVQRATEIFLKDDEDKELQRVLELSRQEELARQQAAQKRLQAEEDDKNPISQVDIEIFLNTNLLDQYKAKQNKAKEECIKETGMSNLAEKGNNFELMDPPSLDEDDEPFLAANPHDQNYDELLKNFTPEIIYPTLDDEEDQNLISQIPIELSCQDQVLWAADQEKPQGNLMEPLKSAFVHFINTCKEECKDEANKVNYEENKDAQFEVFKMEMKSAVKVNGHKNVLLLIEKDAANKSAFEDFDDNLYDFVDSHLKNALSNYNFLPSLSKDKAKEFTESLVKALMNTLP